VSHPLLTQGGPTYRLQEALGLGGPQVSRRVVRALLLSAITFVPLVALAAAQGWALAPDPRRSFLLDYGAYARFLLAVPAFLFAEGSVDARCALILREFVDTKLIAEGQRGAFRAAIERAVRLRDHPLPELGILLLAYLQARSALAFVVSTGHPTWWAPGIPDSSALSHAGWWYLLVSLPLYHFLALLWLWRLAIWTLALKWIADLDLQLRASHPDRTGGLGFLNLSLPPFGLVLFGYGASVGAVALQGVVHQGATIQSLAPFMIGGVVVGVAVMMAPLLVFVNTLIVFQRQAILEYTTLGARYTALFEAKWLGRRGDDESDLLGTGDIQSLADLGNSFEIVRQMRNIPVDPRAVIPLALATAVPMLPAVLVAIGVQPLFKLIVKSVF
jgi:hypothetical protein